MVWESPGVLVKIQICAKTIWIRNLGIYISVSPQVIVFQQRPISLLNLLQSFWHNWAVLLRANTGREERSREPSAEGWGGQAALKKRRERLSGNRLAGEIRVLFHSLIFGVWHWAGCRGCSRSCRSGEWKKKTQTQTMGTLSRSYWADIVLKKGQLELETPGDGTRNYKLKEDLTFHKNHIFTSLNRTWMQMMKRSKYKHTFTKNMTENYGRNPICIINLLFARNLHIRV